MGTAGSIIGDLLLILANCMLCLICLEAVVSARLIHGVMTQKEKKKSTLTTSYKQLFSPYHKISSVIAFSNYHVSKG